MKKIFIFITTILLTVNMMAVNIWDGSSSPWTNGNGTSDDPYLIETAANLAYLAEKVNEGYQASGQAVFTYTYFLMTDDFDLNNINWTPIGNVNMDYQGYYFAGVFDGWYHNINNLKITSNADVCGLFGGLGGTASAPGGSYSGGRIQHLSVTNGDITSTGTAAAGIAGIIFGDGLVYQCSFSGNISVNNNGSFCGAAGIVAATAENAGVVECSNHGSISATNNGGFTNAAGAGGIVVIAMDGSSVRQCYNTGSITANAMLMGLAAGIVASTLNDAYAGIYDSYNVGTISGNSKGGIFGLVSPINPTKNETEITVSNCYYLNTCGGSNNYGTSMTSAEMQTEQFKNQIDMSAHKFVMDNGTNNGYPIHALTGFRINNATDITAHSAKLSAELHPGNASFSRAYFYCVDIDETDYHEVDIALEGYVEAIIEDLLDNTDYMYSMSVEYSDGGFVGFGPRWFTTEFDNITEVNNADIQIYPNPTSDFIHINCKDVPWCVSTPITIYSLDGKLIKTVENSNIIDVRDLNEGIYLINIGNMTRKFAVTSL